MIRAAVALAIAAAVAFAAIKILTICDLLP
jgi:hypothetical protein